MNSEISGDDIRKKYRKFLIKQISALRENNPKVKVFMCEHVKSLELPPVVSSYAGVHTRLLLCAMCIRIMRGTIHDWEFSNHGGPQRLIGRTEGVKFALKHIAEPFIRILRKAIKRPKD